VLSRKSKGVNSLLRIVAFLPAILAGGLLAAVPTVGAESRQTGRVPLPAIQIDKTQGEKCVEPTEVMRRDHMQFILHQRDETMHRGIRTSKHSLKNCVNCHADPKTGSVLGTDGFCASCHRYAAVSMDCFACHTDKAEKEKRATALERLMRVTRPSAPSAGGAP
jgi:hypothetical protein